MDPEKATRWMGQSATLDPRPGGEYSSVAPGASTIEIELEPTDDGTLLHFTHRGFAEVEETQKHAHGWDHYLPRLEIAARGGDPGRDTWLDGMT